ncbi:tripartite tricarboxylate transporter substrate binding protein [Roseomonas sp. 18066]|uniref:Bug family tripartite tricarboxylate transporter substrate binding protein n=1 Tax=Roseomonas sp. 18066 TaxID=2681412 RepID=UPI00135A486C|nr:tripartite tricarboxylate transporter substrate-binding protein [Roseomonas sp. 18066]
MTACFPRRALPGLGLAAALPWPALAQSRLLTVVVPYGAGSTNDILARLLAEAWSGRLGSPVVIDNRAGAGGTLGIGQVARATPDGETIALVSVSSIPINRALYRKLPFDPAADLEIIAVTNATPNVLVVSAKSGLDDLAALLARAKAAAQPIRSFAPGNGTAQHMACVLLAREAGFALENVPYRGFAEGITGLLAGEAEFGFASAPSVAGMLRDGQLKALGITGPRETPLVPGIPTLVAQGFSPFTDIDGWYGLAAPKGVPAARMDRLRSTLRATLEDPAVIARLARAGFDAVPAMTLEQTGAFLQRQVGFWAELAERSGASVD